VYTTRPAEFTYRRASTVDEAVSLLAELDDARPLAGGHSLLPAMKLRLSTPGALVDIGRIPGLAGIERDGDGIRIGALATHAAVASSELVRSECPVLAETASLIGDRQVRNRGTIGGSIAHADPASDMPALLLALDAEIVARSKKGERTIPLREFFQGPFATALAPDEILVEIRFLAGHPEYGSAYRNVEQPASGYSLAGAAVVIGHSKGSGTPFDDVRIAISGVSVDGAYRATAAEKAFVASGKPEDAAAHAVDGVHVSSDIHADAEFRAALARVQVRRALEAAIERAG
jgi:carbon-monoxide dehydrogenase medium subunit